MVNGDCLGHIFISHSQIGIYFIPTGWYGLCEHARIQKGSKFDVFFCFFFFFVFSSLMRGGRIKILLLAGHHRPASETPFEWRFAGVPMMALH